MLPTQHAKDIEAFQHNIGKVVTSISHGRYYFNDIPDEKNDGSLELKFVDGRCLTLSLGSDGQSVCTRQEPLSLPESFDFNSNAHCEWKSIELTSRPDYLRLHGASLTGVEAIIDSLRPQIDNEFVSGWLLRFNTGDFIVYYNYADDSRILLNQYPSVELEFARRRELVVQVVVNAEPYLRN